MGKTPYNTCSECRVKIKFEKDVLEEALLRKGKSPQFKSGMVLDIKDGEYVYITRSDDTGTYYLIYEEGVWKNVDGRLDDDTVEGDYNEISIEDLPSEVHRSLLLKLETGN